MKLRKLPRTFYARDAKTVAQDLLGKYLVHIVDGKARIGKIVETEAYLGPRDLASHSSKGRTPRTEVMFGPAGYAYVYLIYGIHWNVNTVCGQDGEAAAVLIRALEPIQNITGNTKGPGLLCKAMAIDKKHKGHDLLSKELYIAEPPTQESFKIQRGKRIGVDYAKHWAARLLRYVIKDNPYISKRIK